MSAEQSTSKTSAPTKVPAEKHNHPKAVETVKSRVSITARAATKTLCLY